MLYLYDMAEQTINLMNQRHTSIDSKNYIVLGEEKTISYN